MAKKILQPSKRSSTPWVVLCMILLIILAAGAIFVYVSLPYCESCETAEEQGILVADEHQPCPEVCNVPFFYTDVIENGQTSLWMVDRCTSEESLLISYQQEPVELVAAPQINYDGRIFYSYPGEGEQIGISVYVIDVATKESELATFNDLLPANHDAREVSNDQTKMAVVYNNPNMGDVEQAVAVIDLLTGQKSMLGELSEGEYYSRFQGPNTFSGAFEYSIEWLGDTCFQVAIYTDPTERFQSEHEDEKQLDRYERYCIE